MILLLSWLILFNAGAAVFDVESCANCPEANPLMLSDRRWGKYAQKGAVLIPASIWYEKTNSKTAKAILISTLVGQIAAGSYNLRFRF